MVLFPVVSLCDLQVISLQFDVERFHLIPWQPEEVKRPGSFAAFATACRRTPKQKHLLNLTCSSEIALY